MKKTGIMGGTFDPIHNGHLTIAGAAQIALELDEVLFILNPRPPHKESDRLSDSRHRLRMVELALTDYPDFIVSTIEVERPGIAYSVDTVEELLRRDPAQELYFILGADAVRELESWKDPERLLRQCRFIIIDRQGIDPTLPPGSDPELTDLLERRSYRLKLLPPIDISSSDIRGRLKRGEPVDHMIPPAVAEYIRVANAH